MAHDPSKSTYVLRGQHTLLPHLLSYLFVCDLKLASWAPAIRPKPRSQQENLCLSAETQKLRSRGGIFRSFRLSFMSMTSLSRPFLTCVGSTHRCSFINWSVLQGGWCVQGRRARGGAGAEKSREQHNTGPRHHTPAWSWRTSPGRPNPVRGCWRSRPGLVLQSLRPLQFPSRLSCAKRSVRQRSRDQDLVQRPGPQRKQAESAGSAITCARAWHSLFLVCDAGLHPHFPIHRGLNRHVVSPVVSLPDTCAPQGRGSAHVPFSGASSPTGSDSVRAHTCISDWAGCRLGLAYLKTELIPGPRLRNRWQHPWGRNRSACPARRCWLPSAGEGAWTGFQSHPCWKPTSLGRLEHLHGGIPGAISVLQEGRARYQSNVRNPHGLLPRTCKTDLLSCQSSPEVDLSLPKRHLRDRDPVSCSVGLIRLGLQPAADQQGRRGWLTSKSRTDMPWGVVHPRPRTRNPSRTPPRRPNVEQSTLASTNCQAFSLVWRATVKHFSRRPEDCASNCTRSQW